MPTPTPSPTPVPVVQGTITFTGAKTDPLETTVVLSGLDGLTPPVKSGADGTYAVSDVTPGNYNLWVELTATDTMIPGCTDVVVPTGWGISFSVGGGLQLTVKNANTLQQGLDNFKSNGFTGPIFASSPPMAVAAGKTLSMDVTLTCK
jgi:hypothetical protein